jgi:hypothetical protein
MANTLKNILWNVCDFTVIAERSNEPQQGNHMWWTENFQGTNWYLPADNMEYYRGSDNIQMQYCCAMLGTSQNTRFNLHMNINQTDIPLASLCPYWNCSLYCQHQSHFRLGWMTSAGQASGDRNDTHDTSCCLQTEVDTSGLNTSHIPPAQTVE